VIEETIINTDDLIRKHGGRAIFVQTDVGDAQAVDKKLVDAAVAEFGRLDMYATVTFYYSPFLHNVISTSNFSNNDSW